MGVSKNNGTPKSSILIGFSIINHPFWDTPIFGNTYIYIFSYLFSNFWMQTLEITEFQFACLWDYSFAHYQQKYSNRSVESNDHLLQNIIFTNCARYHIPRIDLLDSLSTFHVSFRAFA